jgi:small subunit ribosomal protein S17
MKEKNKPIKRTLKGVVISDKMNKTIVVLVERVKQHPRYRRYYKVGKKYKVHDPEKKYHAGDKVTIQECRPISKEKKWIVL